jgi:hypothetical protein
MIEDIIGWTLLFLIPASIVYAIYKGRQLYKRYKEKQHQAELERMAIAEKNASSWRERISSARIVGKTKYDFDANRTRTTVTDRTTNQSTTYVHHNNDGPDLLTTMIIADMISNNKDSSSGTVSWKDDTPTYTESESRKSSSSSSWFSSSDDVGSSSTWD